MKFRLKLESEDESEGIWYEWSMPDDPSKRTRLEQPASRFSHRECQRAPL